MLALGYSITLKRVALLALDSQMTADWVWIGPSDVLGSEEAEIPGNLQVEDAKNALSTFFSILFFLS